MNYLFFVAFSAVAAILFKPVQNFLASAETKVASGNSAISNFFGTYFGQLAVLTATFFVVLFGAAFVLRFVGGNKAAEIPGL